MTNTKTGTSTKQTAKSKASQALAKSKSKGTLEGLNHTQVKDVFESMKGQIAEALPRHLDADRMIQVATTLIQKNPEIAKCSVKSLMGAVMQASILGFKPLDSLGYCYFVPYKNQVQFQIGYKGYIQLARRSNEIKMIYAETVHENDEFDYKLGLDPKLEHKPATGDRGKLTHVYSVVHYKDGGYNFMVLSKKEVEDLRVYSPMQNRNQTKGAWSSEWGYKQMAKAKVIKQMAKYMPMSEEMEQATQSDEAVIPENAMSNDNSGMNTEEFIHDLSDLEEAEEVNEPQTTETNETQQKEADKKANSQKKQTTSKKSQTKTSTGQTGNENKMNFNQ